MSQHGVKVKISVIALLGINVVRDFAEYSPSHGGVLVLPNEFGTIDGSPVYQDVCLADTPTTAMLIDGIAWL
jgi:hypothetical protein